MISREGGGGLRRGKRDRERSSRSQKRFANRSGARTFVSPAASFDKALDRTSGGERKDESEIDHLGDDSPRNRDPRIGRFLCRWESSPILGIFPNGRRVLS